MLLSAIGLGLAVASPTIAAGYPEKPVTMIVPFPAGGASDTTARLVGSKMAETLGQSVVVDNRPGANGSLGAGMIAQAKPDGYTMLVGSIGVFAINPVLYKGLKYDPLKNFDLLTVAVRTPNVLVVNPNIPVNSVAELVDHLKKNPDTVTFATSGAGSSDHLTTALFWQKTGTTGLHVPYKGGAPAITDLIGGHADASFQNLGAVANHIKAGKLKLLGVTSDKRNAMFPDAPTMAEAGVQGVEVYSWQAVAAPKGLPADVKAKLESSLSSALSNSEVKGRFNDIGFEVVGNTSAQFTDFLTAEIARWKSVVETGKITAEQ
ncbi:Bug family tripartite tricarboxylate transporter substrate binding protein [Azospirillum brasilense]|nr:tripartite tricarboxylate transporter substrate binding protein [Azospirillum brasilense]